MSVRTSAVPRVRCLNAPTWIENFSIFGSTGGGATARGARAGGSDGVRTVGLPDGAGGCDDDDVVAGEPGDVGWNTRRISGRVAMLMTNVDSDLSDVRPTATLSRGAPWMTESCGSESASSSIVCVAAAYRIEAELSSTYLLGSRAPVQNDDGTINGFVGRIGGAVAVDVPNHASGDGSERHQSEGQLFRVAAAERHLHLGDERRIEIDGQRGQIDPDLLHADRHVDERELSRA